MHPVKQTDWDHLYKTIVYNLHNYQENKFINGRNFCNHYFCCLNTEIPFIRWTLLYASGIQISEADSFKILKTNCGINFICTNQQRRIFFINILKRNI